MVCDSGRKLRKSVAVICMHGTHGCWWAQEGGTGTLGDNLQPNGSSVKHGATAARMSDVLELNANS
jgi:hypothetical protein